MYRSYTGDPSEIKITHQIGMNKSKKIEGIEYLQEFRIEQIANWVIPEIWPKW